MSDPIRVSDDQRSALNELAEVCSASSRSNGWYEPREIEGVVREASAGERIALIHEEATELLRHVRNGKPSGFWTEIDGKPEGPDSELADIIIRCLDYAGRYGIPIGTVIAHKVAYNGVRTDWTEKVL